MAKRGRKTLGANVVAFDASRTRPRLTPPSILTKAERALFAEVVANNAHLRAGDVPMLGAYVQALTRTYRLSKRNDAASSKSWQEAARVSLAMARSLRLTAINQTHRDTVGRQNANATPMSYYKRSEMEDDE